MKNALKFIFSFLVALALALIVAHKAYVYYNISPAISVAAYLVFIIGLAIFGGLGVSQYVVKNDITIDQVFWAKLIIKRLFKNNAFLNYAMRDDQYVVGGSAVVIPQPGAAPAVIKNNTSFPMVAIQRADSMIMYALNSYATQPTFITIDELQNISYDKTDSVLRDHFGYLIQSCADDQVINWANGLPGASNVVYTSGPATLSLEAGQAGSRNSCQASDVKKLQRMMNKGNVPEDGRVLLMESNMYDQFTDSLSATQYRDYSEYYDARTGVLGRMYGFDIMTRSSVIMASAAFDGNGNLQVNALGAALGATDNVGCLAWQKESLALAMGSITLFTRTQDPLYTGDVNNARIKAGGRVRRADYAGVYALMQGTPAAN